MSNFEFTRSRLDILFSNTGWRRVDPSSRDHWNPYTNPHAKMFAPAPVSRSSLRGTYVSEGSARPTLSTAPNNARSKLFAPTAASNNAAVNAKRIVSVSSAPISQPKSTLSINRVSTAKPVVAPAPTRTPVKNVPSPVNKAPVPVQKSLSSSPKSSAGPRTSIGSSIPVRTSISAVKTAVVPAPAPSTAKATQRAPGISVASVVPGPIRGKPKSADPVQPVPPPIPDTQGYQRYVSDPVGQVPPPQVEETPPPPPASADLSSPTAPRHRYSTSLSPENSLAFVHVHYQAQRSAIKILKKYVDTRNMRDFYGVWDELSRAVLVEHEIELRYVLPTLELATKGAITAASLTPGRAVERAAAAVVETELREKRAASAESFTVHFTAWRSAAIHCIEERELAFAMHQAELGESFAASSERVYKTMMCPVMRQYKTEFLQTVGWIATTLNNDLEVATLGLFVETLQLVTSAPQFTLIRDALRSKVTSELWHVLATRNKVNEAGKQTDIAEPAEVPLKEDPMFANYFKIAKIGLPKEAVALKMFNSGVASSLDEALAILALDPNKPMPSKLETKPVAAVAVATPIKASPKPDAVRASPSAASSPSSSSSVNPLLFLDMFHAAFVAAAASLNGYMTTGSMRDFSFIWEEFVKALNFHSDMEDRFVFPLLIESGSAAATQLKDDHYSEKRAIEIITGRLNLSLPVELESFYMWRDVALKHMEEESALLKVAVAKYAQSQEELARIVAKEIVSPTVARNKSDFMWTASWCAMMLSRSGKPDDAIAQLGQLLQSLQAVCSPSQFTLLKGKIKINTTSDQWTILKEKYNVEQPGAQPEPENIKPSIKDDQRFVKYFKMIKMGLPAEAAAQQMVRDAGFTTDYDVALKILGLDPYLPLPDNIKAR